MNFTIQIEGDALKPMLDGRRIAGTLGISADGRLSFNAWRSKPAEPYHYIRLRHGRASVGRRRIRLYLDMDRAEKVEPVNAIYSDLYDAVSFIREEVKPTTETKEDEGKRPA